MLPGKRSPSRPGSLALRLFLYAAGWCAVALVVVGVFLSSLYRETVENNFDNYLKVFLKGLVATVEVSGNGGLVLEQSLAEPRFDFPLSGWYWQVMQARLPLQPILSSPSLLEFRMKPPQWSAEHKSAGNRAFFLGGPDEKMLRVVERQIVLPGSKEKYIFTVAGDSANINDVVTEFNGTLITALVILGAGLIGAVLLQVKLGLRPLTQIRDSLSAIRSGEESRLKGEFPREINPLAKELNALLDYNKEIVERARTHVGNLAHALKTPLSVLTNEAHSNPGNLSTKINEQTLIMKDQIGHYLDRARVAARANVIGSRTDVEPVLESILRVLNRINEERGIKTSIDCTKGLQFRGEKQDLEEMVGNLIDNAFKWVRSEIKISARKMREDDGAGVNIWIIIEDDGPGLPSDNLGKAKKRGQRFDESKPGSGLGLSIVGDTAALYKGSLELEKSTLGGLKATIILPSVKNE